MSESWSGPNGLKKQLIASGDNPSGHLPVVFLPSGQILTEHHAILRRFARQLGLYGQDLEHDYHADVLADNTVIWRTKWVASLFAGEAAKAEYEDQVRPHVYNVFETLLTRYDASGVSAVGDKASFVDALVFGLLYDDQEAYGEDVLKSSPRLAAFYQAYVQLAGVKEWVEEHSSRQSTQP